MQLINTTTVTPAELAANNIVANLNAQLQSRVQAHLKLYSYFWDNESATPAEILQALGPHAGLFLACADENVQHLTKVAALVGKSLEEFLPQDRWKPRSNIVVNQNGTATITDE